MQAAAKAVTVAVLAVLLTPTAGCGPDPAWPAAAPPRGPQRAAPGAPPGTKMVEYGDYAIDVPASWPVYRLAWQPHRCLRYDIHAVYLGNPGPDQQCPAHLVGRTEAVWIGGGGGAVAGAGAAVTHQRAGAPAGQAQGRAARDRVIVRNAVGREFGLRIKQPRLALTATYANDPRLVERIISSVRRAHPPQPTSQPASPALPRSVPRAPHVRSAPSAPSAPSGRPAISPVLLAAHAKAGADGRSWAGGQLWAGGRSGAGAPAASAASRAAAERRRPARARRPIAGFDTCTAPSIRAMRAWRPFYAAIAIYVGGANRACDSGNLSARWVRRVKAMGWSLIPAYVGLQPPCDHFSSKIEPRRAAREGAAAADNAVALAHRLGLRRHAPIYFDMEAYNLAKRRCRAAVLTFLDAWSRRLRALGHVPGAYSSAESGARDLGRTTMIAGHRLARPAAIWFALWDGRENLRGQPYLKPSWWPRYRRIKQFRGDRWRKHGGFRLDIDRDEVFGPVC